MHNIASIIVSNIRDITTILLITISLLKLISQSKILNVRTAFLLGLILINGMSLSLLKRSIYFSKNINLNVILFKIYLILLLLIMFLSAIFFEDMYEGHLNSIILGIIAFLMGYNMYYYSSLGIMYVYLGEEIRLDIIITHHLLTYMILTDGISGYFGMMIYLKGKRKFYSGIYRQIIHIFGFFSVLNFIPVAILILCFINLTLYYEFRSIISSSFTIYFLSIAMLTIWRPGFYLVNAYNTYYFVVYDINSGLPIYIKNYTVERKSLDLLSNLLTALQHLSDEIIKTEVNYIVTKKHVIVMESIYNIGVSVTVEKYHPNISKLLKLFLINVKKSIEERAELSKIFEIGVIIIDDEIRKEVEKEISEILSCILP